MEQAMQEYELTEDDKKIVRPLAQRWSTFRRASFLLMIKQRKLGTFRVKTKKAKKVGLVGCSYHRKQKLQTHSTPIFTQRKRKKPAPREVPAPPGAVESKRSGKEKRSSEQRKSSSGKSSGEGAVEEAEEVTEDRLALYRRQAALKMWSPTSDRMQPPVNQIIGSLAEAFSVSVEQILQDWKNLDHDHPFREVVSLRKRMVLRHNLLDEETCEALFKMVTGKGNWHLQAAVQDSPKDSMVARACIWDNYRPVPAWKQVFNMLPKSFFFDVGEVFRHMVGSSFVTEAVDLGEMFVPQRMQFNMYPAGKLSGLAPHWDRLAIAGVLTILISPLPEDGVCDLKVKPRLGIRGDPGKVDDAGWVNAKLQRGSGVCILAGTPHNVRTWVRKEPRVTLNVVF